MLEEVTTIIKHKKQSKIAEQNKLCLCKKKNKQINNPVFVFKFTSKQRRGKVFLRLGFFLKKIILGKFIIFTPFSVLLLRLFSLLFYFKIKKIRSCVCTGVCVFLPTSLFLLCIQNQKGIAAATAAPSSPYLIVQN